MDPADGRRPAALALADLAQHHRDVSRPDVTQSQVTHLRDEELLNVVAVATLRRKPQPGLDFHLQPRRQVLRERLATVVRVSAGVHRGDHLDAAAVLKHVNGGGLWIAT
jgi:hypothetical protein